MSIHDHSWYINTQNTVEELCACGKIKISDLERERRIEEWMAWNEYIRTTDSYLRFSKCKELFFQWNRTRDKKYLESIKQLAREADQAIQKNEYTKTSPVFPNPLSSDAYVDDKEIIFESWDDLVED